MVAVYHNHSAKPVVHPMIQGNGHDTAEAGPSGWQSNAPVSSQDYGFDLVATESEVGDDNEEMLYEAETSLVEDALFRRKASPPIASVPLSTRRLSSSTTTILPRLITPNSSLGSTSHIRPNSSRKGSYLRVNDGSLHTSASEIFNQPPPPLTRHTTYSSLPPSPRHESTFDFGPSPAKGLGINELEDVLVKLQHTRDPPKIHRMDTDNPGEEDEFWPADSRRHSVIEDMHDERSPSPEVGLGGRGDVEPTSPDSVSFWDLLKDEVGAEDWDGYFVDGKWERIANFLAVPLAVEKVTLFGALLCLDGFLYDFTILPIRAIFAFTRIFINILKRRAIWPIPPTHIHSILRLLLLVIPTVILLVGTDSSKMYHAVRGQDTIKLYVIFNALEIADRLCCAFGQDVLDTLFAKETLAPSRRVGRGRRRQQARPVFFFLLSLGYVLVHALIFFYMLVSLNVAINSYDYTLLSLLISNQFVEIKGSVFKKFEKENLFQIMCADIVERFQLSLMLSVIALRNMIEMAGSDIAFLPKSFIRGKSLVETILSPVLFVIMSEMVVDWLKHAFIAKFNHVRASVYERFTDVLAKDVLLAGSLGGGRSRAKGRKHPVLLDQSPLVARRLGFASIPLACLVIRVGMQAIGMLTSSAHHTDDSLNLSTGGWAWDLLRWGGWIGVGMSAWGCLVALKILLGLSLLSFSALRQAGMEDREAADAVNDFGRSGVGESKEEKEYNRQTTQHLSQDRDNLPEYASPTTAFSPEAKYSLNSPVSPVHRDSLAQVATTMNAGTDGPQIAKPKGKKWKLEEVERWTMVKRIW